jgi:D-alanyl-D-alanine carboxypeptidase
MDVLGTLVGAAVIAAIAAAPVAVAAPPSSPLPTQPSPSGPVDNGTLVSSVSPELQAGLDALVAAGVPGVVVLSRNGDHTEIGSAGVADLEQGTPMTTDTAFRTGTLAKTFVATVAMQLNEGALSLEDTAEDWLPGVVPKGAGITIRQLLGTRVACSTSSRIQHRLHVAGDIIEAATSSTFADEVRTRITEPLGLADTAIPLTTELTAPYAHGYFVDLDMQDVTALSPTLSSFGGNLVSTVSDASRFYDELFGGELVSADSVAEMETTTTSTVGEVLGLGLQVIDMPCGSFIGHSGSTPGYKAAAFNDVEHDRQFVIFVNSLTLDDQVGSLEASAAFDQAAATAACG